MKYLISKSSQVLGGGTSQSDIPQSERVQSTRSVDHIHADKINFLQEKAQENKQITELENTKVAELKMKAA